MMNANKLAREKLLFSLQLIPKLHHLSPVNMGYESVLF